MSNRSQVVADRPVDGVTETGQQDAVRRTDLDPQSRENIFLFWPNMIGYIRVILAVWSLYYMPLHPRRCSILYSVSCLLDALDGYAARIFNQSTRFGAVLDMVTDRCTTSCLLVFLAIAQPAYAPIYQGLISLDFASHYMHMYATLAMGGEGQSHKSVSTSRSRIMNFYYKKWVLFTCCAGNELFFIGLYLLCFSSSTTTFYLLSSNGPPKPASLPASPFSAAAMEIARANKINDTVPWILTLGSAPIMVFKQCINVLQLVKASQWLAEGDRRQRKAVEIAKTR
ncbi:CDP-diacylglycerol--inositol 3-phosphatidyltransferase [Fulvia fulva]|uniref:CDP-diacylglycerol--inositol 3-phosphatidyltransferase n=1 Tax=Passalora fulva TaxID=5499 RepID=A0A9Q8LCI6_PASFU|nr:CDP-diacylglycerol--inositol 3-phosphatidyltransferase [Fulvia fulva]KAK4629708.1 CDP-diacylglycerol--inositol 3-phosphatidyltransferase [Fulvia fulva]KAK4630827.1 CDP-diacylglycerol--inositol 3-phosphatidyltransferase [Fulvia fulva]UJO15006.1 CDP-diacylglycerol--inositol 3-phosphatidyltransferase [Fulvia fulva]WPV12852.1 CDP-diacylglycerol--inositol 3-phosphatidyltransferase [Fulvia fulva]WPV27610.1 CDP-diacylglycerol--inositol 3-phosphatidyltransferase [Fulvia fulva]